MVVVVIFGVVVVVADAEAEAAVVVVSLSSGVGCSPHAVTLAAIASAAARAAKRLNFFMMNVLSFLPLIVRQNVMFVLTKSAYTQHQLKTIQKILHILVISIKSAVVQFSSADDSKFGSSDGLFTEPIPEFAVPKP